MPLETNIGAVAARVRNLLAADPELRDVHWTQVTTSGVFIQFEVGETVYMVEVVETCR